MNTLVAAPPGGQPGLDLNADLGEGSGNDSALLGIVSSANVACGGHAGDAVSMRKVVEEALVRGVAIGAHPSFPDREGFGRSPMRCTPDEIVEFMRRQIDALVEVALASGARVLYVKPHGALGNLASEDPTVAASVADAVARYHPDLAMLAMGGSALERASRDRGVVAYKELYADRGYTPSGQLVPRSSTGALLEDEESVVRRLRHYLQTGHMEAVDGSSVALDAHSICVHGDNAHAVQCARSVRALLEDSGRRVMPFRLG